MLENVQVAQRVTRLREGQEVARDPDDEAAEDEDEREDGREDLVLRQRRRERARGDEERADERDRAKFAKARSYMVRRDDMVMCKNMRCRKRFDITGQSTVITE